MSLVACEVSLKENYHLKKLPKFKYLANLPKFKYLANEYVEIDWVSLNFCKETTVLSR